MLSIKENLLRLKKTLPPHVTLVAVSKTKPVEQLMDAYDAGQRDFGENYVQELTDKEKVMPKDICWHFIGHLQSNKVKYIAPFVYLIHGVDSLKLLREINKQGEKNKKVINCLLQVYIAKEESKFGFDKNEISDLLDSGSLMELKYVSVKGLMGMASNVNSEKTVSEEFTDLAYFFNWLKQKETENFQMLYLSCGMSSDYKLAIAAGSNMLRIGSSIFGERNYQ
ncbi:MAG TPA: YggS family pyridoxal phosphate-dependent enzyme [Bacteroidia bacterium]|nr:YggS family pyridoxal phosphate-dependent enzyme [Bacteroidia bacterium]